MTGQSGWAVFHRPLFAAPNGRYAANTGPMGYDEPIGGEVLKRDIRMKTQVPFFNILTLYMYLLGANAPL